MIGSRQLDKLRQKQRDKSECGESVVSRVNIYDLRVVYYHVTRNDVHWAVLIFVHVGTENTTMEKHCKKFVEK
jgi:hypothetical protein